MRTYEEMQSGCAEMLKELRIRTGSTRSRMAEAAMCDRKTWGEYESGASSPTVPQFMHVLSDLGVDALRTVLDYCYPDIYLGLDSDSPIEELRAAAAHYFMSVASERTVRQWDYLILGQHGSSFGPQINEWVMLDRLPMEYRLIIASVIDKFYQLAEAHGTLVGTDHVEPNLEMFHDGLKKGEEAARKRMNSYSIAMEE